MRTTTRNLQNITIIDEDDGPSNNNAPTRSPVAAVPRPTTIRVCVSAASDAVVDTVEVTYRYEVKIDSGEVADLTWSTSIPSWVDGATVDILAGQLCAGSDDNTSNRLLSNLLPCVLSITSGSRDAFLNESCSTCGLYSGNVRVSYTDLCEKDQVVDAVLNFLTAGSGESDLLQIVNELAQSDEINLTSVKYSEYTIVEEAEPTEEPALSSELDDAPSDNALNNGLTRAGIAMISMLGVFLVFLLAVFYLRRKQAKKGKKDDDAHSTKTAGSTPFVDRDRHRPEQSTPGSLNATMDFGNDAGSNDSVTLKRRGGTARILFGDGDSHITDSVTGTDAAIHPEDTESIQMDSFQEILNDVTYVRKEEPETDVGSQQVDRPKLSLQNSATFVAL